MIINAINSKLDEIISNFRNTDILRGSNASKIINHSIKIFSDIKNNRNISQFLFAHLNITSFCNMECLHCSVWKWQNKKHIDTEKLFNIFKLLKKYSVETITLGGGEPFLHPNICEIIDKAYESKFKIGIISNGSVLSNKHIETICEKVSWIRFSIDSSNSRTFKICRGRDDLYSVILSNLHNLIAYKNKKLSNIEIGINFVIQKENYHQIEDMIILANNIGIDYLLFKLVHGERANNLSENDLCIIKNILLNSQTKNHKIDINSTELLNFINRISTSADIISGYPVKTFYSTNMIKCYASLLFLTIDCNGNVYPCDYLLYDTRDEIQFAHLRNKFKLSSYNNFFTNSFKYKKKIIRAYDINECGCCTRFSLLNKFLNELNELYNELHFYYQDSEIIKIFNVYTKKLANDTFLWL